VRFDVADHDVGAGCARAARSLEHRVRLTDPSRGAKENPQPATPRARLIAQHFGQQLVGVARSPSAISYPGARSVQCIQTQV